MNPTCGGALLFLIKPRMLRCHLQELPSRSSRCRTQKGQSLTNQQQPTTRLPRALVFKREGGRQIRRGSCTNLVKCFIPDGSSKTNTLQGTGKALQVFLTLFKNLGSKKWLAVEYKYFCLWCGYSTGFTAGTSTKSRVPTALEKRQQQSSLARPGWQKPLPPPQQGQTQLSHNGSDQDSKLE